MNAQDHVNLLLVSAYRDGLLREAAGHRRLRQISIDARGAPTHRRLVDLRRISLLPRSDRRDAAPSPALCASC